MKFKNNFHKIVQFSCTSSCAIYIYIYIYIYGPGSSVGIATDYGLDGPPVQTGSRAHPASCTMGTGSCPEVEAAGAWG